MRAFLFALIALTGLWSAPTLAQSADPARAVVQQLDDGLLATMKAGKAAGTRGRAGIIGPVVDRTFDIGLMTRLVVGTGWTAMTPADQTALVTAFRRLTIASYADNFDSWSGESFAIAPQVEERAGDRLVRTTLNVPRQAPVAIGYRLRRSGSDWRIVDIYYNGSISQLATRRADFAGVLRSGGAKALVEHINALATKAGG